MSINNDTSVKLRTISIENYKGIDAFSMDLPIPKMPNDSDILVMGSKNGLGKTSVIECCALLITCMNVDEVSFNLDKGVYSVDIPDFIIQAGKNATRISGDLVAGESAVNVDIWVDRNGLVRITTDREKSKDNVPFFVDLNNHLADYIGAICGFSADPVIDDKFLLFHSYRKVQEGNPELGMMLKDLGTGKWKRGSWFSLGLREPLSEFKVIILRALMNRADLFDIASNEKPDESVDKLNELIGIYADGKISKLRPSDDNTVDFRIAPNNGNSSITFDGLSSGQKEIISTLFLIWYYTKDTPFVVFVDEPELHLNAQWHRTFINNLIRLAPNNQYIIATHSESIMDSVLPHQRRILQEKN